jgi:hypothetical protein
LYFVHTARRARLLVAIVSASVLAFGIVACGDDDEGDEGEPVTEVTLTADEASADEFTFELSETPTAETTSVTFDNQGEQAHALLFARVNEGYTVDEAFELEGRQGSAVEIAQAGAEPGQSSTVEVKEPLEPGHYAMLCPIGDPEVPESLHYKLGQLVEFDIE